MDYDILMNEISLEKQFWRVFFCPRVSNFLRECSEAPRFDLLSGASIERVDRICEH